MAAAVSATTRTWLHHGEDSNAEIHPTRAMRAHPADADPDRMPSTTTATDGDGPSRYEVRVRGPIGPTTMQAFPTLGMSRNGHDTLLTGPLPDQPALYGVIHQLEALGLQLLEIRRLGTGDPRTTRPIT
jgi:hypothetical protein